VADELLDIVDEVIVRGILFIATAPPSETDVLPVMVDEVIAAESATPPVAKITPPLSAVAVLLEIVDEITVRLPFEEIAPPNIAEVFDIFDCFIITLPVESIAPPRPPAAELLKMVTVVRVNEFEDEIAPPSPAADCPFRRVRLSRVNIVPAALNIPVMLPFPSMMVFARVPPAVALDLIVTSFTTEIPPWT